MHGPDLSLNSHLKEFLGNGVRTHVNSMGKIPSTGKNYPQRRIEPTTLQQAGQQAHHTTNELFRTAYPCYYSNYAYCMCHPLAEQRPWTCHTVRQSNTTLRTKLLHTWVIYKSSVTKTYLQGPLRNCFFCVFSQDVIHSL